MKSLGTGTQALYDGPAPGQIHLVEMLTTPTTWFTSAPFNVTLLGREFFGLGNLVSIAPIKETEGIEATAAQIVLSAVSTSSLAIALGDQIQGKACTIWSVDVREDGSYGTPTVEFVGRMDTMPWTHDGDTATVTLIVESRMAAMLSTNVRRMTDAEQQSRHAGDRFFEHLPAMTEKALAFPSAVFFRR